MKQQLVWVFVGGALAALLSLLLYHLADRDVQPYPASTASVPAAHPHSVQNHEESGKATTSPKPASAETPAPSPITDAEPALPSSLPPWTLHGTCVRIHDGKEVPVPHAHVEVRRGWDDLGGPLSLTADAKGRFIADLAPLRFVPARERRENSGCEAHSPAYATRDAIEIPDIPIDPTQPFRGSLKLVLDPCATISGRVVDERGRPVPGATLQSRGINALEKPEDEPAHFLEETLEEAAFSYRCFTTGRIKLGACESGVGVSRWTEVEVHPPAPVRVPDLVLRPVGVIEGRAVFPDGSPAAHLELEIDAEGDVFSRWDGDRFESETYTWVRTDEEGHFSVRSLFPGWYSIRPMSRPPDWEPEGIRAHTGARDVALPIRRPVIVVSVSDAHGRRMKDGAATGITTWLPPYADRAAALHAAGGDPYSIENLISCIHCIQGERVHWFAQPGSYHHLAIGWDGYAPDLHAVRFPTGKWCEEVELTYRAAQGLAKVSICLLDDNGKELIDRVATLVPVGQPPRKAWRTSGPALAAKPLLAKPGRYRLRVRFNFPDSNHGYGEDWSQFRGAFSPVEQEVTLSPGVHRLSLRTRRSAFLQARVWIDRSAPDDYATLIVVGAKQGKRARLKEEIEFVQGGTKLRYTEWLPLTPGPYDVILDRRDQPQVKRVITLAAGSVCPIEF